MVFESCYMECAKCNSYLGTFINSWTRYGPNHYSPLHGFESERPWVMNGVASLKIKLGPFKKSQWKTFQCMCGQILGAMSDEPDLESTLSQGTLLFLDTSIILKSMLDKRDILDLRISSLLYSDNGRKPNGRSAANLPAEEIHDESLASQTPNSEPGSRQQLTRGFLIEGSQGNAVVGNNVSEKRSQTLVRTKRTVNALKSKGNAPEDEANLLKATIADLKTQLTKIQGNQQKDRQKTDQDMMALKRELEDKVELIRRCETNVATLKLEVVQLQESRKRHGASRFVCAVKPSKRLVPRAKTQEASAKKEKKQRKRRDVSKSAQQLVTAERAALKLMESTLDAISSDKKGTFTLDCILDRRLKRFFYVRWAIDGSESWVQRKDILDKQMVHDFEDGYKGLNEGIEIIQKKKDTTGNFRYKAHWKNGNPRWPEWVAGDALSSQCLEKIEV